LLFVWHVLVVLGNRMETYPDIEFNSSPENQHRRISITKGYPVDLGEPKNGTNCREQAEQE
jgi:hypothetical protein